MSKLVINLGTAPTGVGGDTPRSAFTKTQSNFDELYGFLGASGSPLALPPALPVTRGGTGGNSLATARAGIGVRSGDVKWRSNRGDLTIASDSYTTIDWTNDVYGTGGIHSQTVNPSDFVLPVGIFLISVSVSFNFAAAGRRGVRLTFAGAPTANGTKLDGVSPNGITTVMVTHIARIVTAGTVMRVQAFQDSGSPLILPMNSNNAVDIYQLE